VLTAFVVVITAFYPFLVYFGLAHLRPGVFGLVLAALILVRLLNYAPAVRRRLLLLLSLMTVYALTVAVTNSENLLRLYPVLANLMMLAIFLTSLYTETPILERLARWRGMTITQFGVPYLRNLTKIWCAFFLLTALMAAWTALKADLATWALFNGLLVYLLMGLLLGGEYLFRGYYKKRVGVDNIE